MTISDNEGDAPQISSRKRAKPEPAEEEQEDDSSDEDGAADDSSDDGEEQADDSSDDDDGDDDSESDDDDGDEGPDAEDPSFGGSFHFEASDDDSEDEVVHAWDLGEARATAVQGGKGTNLRAKIDATLRRKGPSHDVVPADGAAEAEEKAAQDVDDAKAVEPVSAKAKKKQQAKALKALAGSAKRGGDGASGGGDEEEATVLTKKANVKHSGKGWEELSLSRPLLRAVKDLGFTHPTPIQAEAIPYALQGRDICGAAVTGSGKTAAFILPVLERLIYRPRRIAATRVLIITPTRELAVQIHAMTTGLGRHTDVRVAMAVGGLSLQTQETALRTRPDIVVATPGRMIDLIRNSNSISMEELEILIMDEADRLLDLGFADEVEELVKLCPRGRQTMLYSATMSANVKTLVSLSKYTGAARTTAR